MQYILCYDRYVGMWICTYKNRICKHLAIVWFRKPVVKCVGSFDTLRIYESDGTKQQDALSTPYHHALCNIYRLGTEIDRYGKSHRRGSFHDNPGRCYNLGRGIYCQWIAAHHCCVTYRSGTYDCHQFDEELCQQQEKQ